MGFILGWLLGRAEREYDRDLTEDGPFYTMADRPRLRAERAENEKPPGVVAWCIIFVLIVVAVFKAPSTMDLSGLRAPHLPIEPEGR